MCTTGEDGALGGQLPDGIGFGSSQDVAAALEDRVRTLLGRQITGFNLRWTERGIVLEGRARSYYQKQLAQHAVMRICTVPILANDILVE